MQTLLFILIEFPPINSAGVFRPLRFINACAAAGYRVVVVTPSQDKNLLWPVSRIDMSLNEQVHKSVIVHTIPLEVISKMERTKIHNFFFTYFNVTDKFGKAWRKNLLGEIGEVINKYKPVCIITSLPPFGIGKLVEKISRRFKIPLILDLRDAWSQLAMVPNATYFHYLGKLLLEKKVFLQASSILTVTPQLCNSVKKSQPSLIGKNVQTIYNAFNLSEIDFSKKIYLNPIQDKDELNIGYVGAFYFDMTVYKNLQKKWWQKKIHHNLFYTPVKENWLYRSPFYFLQTLSSVIKKRPEWRKKITFHHIGETPAWVYDMIRNINSDINFVSHGYLGHDKVNETIKGFDILLATSEKVLDDEHYCLPSKVFTYLKNLKPIIGFVTEGIQKEFIERSGAGTTFDPDNIEQSALMLESLFESGIDLKPDKDYLKQFDSSYTNMQFLNVVKNISEPAI